MNHITLNQARLTSKADLSAPLFLIFAFEVQLTASLMRRIFVCSGCFASGSVTFPVALHFSPSRLCWLQSWCLWELLITGIHGHLVFWKDCENTVNLLLYCVYLYTQLDSPKCDNISLIVISMNYILTHLYQHCMCKTFYLPAGINKVIKNKNVKQPEADKLIISITTRKRLKSFCPYKTLEQS